MRVRFIDQKADKGTVKGGEEGEGSIWVENEPKRIGSLGV